MVVHFPASDLLVYRSVGFPTIGYINPYYWVDDHPLLYGNIGSLDPIAHVFCFCLRIPGHECVQQLFGSCMTVLHGGCGDFDPLTGHEGWGKWWTQAMWKKHQDI